MSTLKVLKEYLVGDGGYLLNDDNNGKTVMLSGAWGSGKTHFWLEEIKPSLTEKKQKNIYISLYGRESISELKFEVLKEAYNLEVKDDIISKSASMLSTIAPSLGEKSLVDGFDKLNKKAKEKKAEEILKSGSIICLDDFERKSTKIDLNDLFGYISQLALDYKCKVVIILNSDVFEGEEANVFKTVKEKTVNKFFYFEPSIEELFESIYGVDGKYKKLDVYKDEIISTIKETEELNARIYVQVLDNCLEWADKGYDKNSLRVLVLNTICFIKNHFILSYPVYTEMRESNSDSKIEVMAYNELRPSSDLSFFIIKQFPLKDLNAGYTTKNKIAELHDSIISFIGEHGGSQVEKDNMLREIDKNYEYYMKIIIFGYKLYVSKDINEEKYNEVTMFIKSGILLPNREKSS